MAAAASALFLMSATAAAFGVNYNPEAEPQRGVAFEEDVKIEAAQVENPLSSGLYCAWQSEMEDPTGKLPPIGGHWGFQILPGAPGNGRKPVHTFNVGWMSDAAVLPLENRALVRTMKTWSRPAWIDNTERMKSEIELNLRANPQKPNLFLGYVGHQRGLPGTNWPDDTYHVVDWKPNEWYHVRFGRDPKPVTVRAWVLHMKPEGGYYFASQPESVSAYAWRVTLTLEEQLENGTFRPKGEPLQMAPIYLPAAYERIRPLNCWGECLGHSPTFPIRWVHANPRVTSASGEVVRIRKANATFWGYDDPSCDAGPVGDSRATHSFFIGYAGFQRAGSVTFSPARRGMRDGGLLWDDAAKPPVSIQPKPVLIEWKEESVAACLRSLPGARYRAEEALCNGEKWTVNRSLTLAPGRNVRIEYARLFGQGAAGLQFEALTLDDKWLVKDAQGFSISPAANGGKPFHVQVEAWAPGTSNTVGWLDLQISLEGAGK